MINKSEKTIDPAIEQAKQKKRARDAKSFHVLAEELTAGLAAGRYAAFTVKFRDKKKKDGGPSIDLQITYG